MCEPKPEWQKHWPRFRERMEERLQEGHLEYGDGSFDRRTGALLDEIQQELEDVMGWGFILWCRLERVRRVPGSEMVDARSQHHGTRIPPAVVQRFRAGPKRRVGECLRWEGPSAGGPFGGIVYRGQTYFVHRLAHALHRQSQWMPPKSKQVRHRCDDPRCVEQTHLYSSGWKP